MCRTVPCELCSHLVLTPSPLLCTQTQRTTHRQAFPAAPRVNSAVLSKHVGKVVTLVGRVVSQDAETVRVQAADGKEVIVKKSSPDAMAPTSFVEYVGTVNPDMSVSEVRSTPFGDSFDLDTYNELVQLADGPHASLFV